MPFILFENHCQANTVSAQSTVTNFPAANASDGKTNTQTAISGTGNGIDYDFGAAKTWDTLAIARHNFAEAMNGTTDSVMIYGKAVDTDAWTLVHSDILPVSNDVYTTTYSSVSYRYCAIRFNFTNATPYMADISLGERLDLERSQKHGFIKPEFADSDKIIANITRGQNLVGLNINQAPKRAKFRLFYYTSAFFARWSSLITELKQHPIYIQWNDSEKPFYCWPASSIPQPKYSANIQNHYDAVLDMSGITE